MEFLPQQNKVVAGDAVPNQLTAKGKRVVILGGGDTGSDCLGTSNRQGAISVHQFELLPRPPDERTADMPWPYWPMIYRTSSSHEEGVVRDFSINTKSFSGENGKVKRLHAVRLEWLQGDNGRPRMAEIAGSEFVIDCDLALLALGFLGPERGGPITDLGLKLDERGNAAADANYMTSVPGVFACGDLRRGQSLVVWAIWEGREAARGIDAFLMGTSHIPSSPMV
jgi:glutamate synthase (NADPH/NADH) small chain